MTACNFTAVQFCMISALALVKFSGPVFSNRTRTMTFSSARCCGGRRRRRFRRRLARCVAVSGWTWSAGQQDKGPTKSKSRQNCCCKIMGFSTIISHLQLYEDYEGTTCDTESAFNVCEHSARGPRAISLSQDEIAKTEATFPQSQVASALLASQLCITVARSQETPQRSQSFRPMYVLKTDCKPVPGCSLRNSALQLIDRERKREHCIFRGIGRPL